MDDTKIKIISAAIKAVRQYGLEGVRIQNISKFAGVSPGALYRYFDGKEQLMLDGREIARLAAEGDEIAKKAFEMAGRYLGQVIAACVMLLNPERVVIGGGVAMSFELFKESLMEVVKTEAKSLRGYFPKIQVTALGYDSGLLGAAAIALCELDC